MAEFGDDIFFASIPELGARIRAREFSVVELTRAFCGRLETLGPRYNALALSLRERALRQARQVDEEGIPYAAKDLLSVAGHPTTWGARPYAAQVFDHDATIIRKLDRAGAILIGKLALVELAGGGGYRYPSASLFGPGLNPWDLSRWSGGSSSGSGSAVAAGLAPFALGSETWGSILGPCANCGITGLRPTYGLVSRHGAMALTWTMDKIGPMGRSAQDCGLILREIAGGDSNDPGSAGKSFFYAPQFSRAFQDLRVGFAAVDFEEWAEPSARPAFREALEALRQTGVQVKEAELPDFPYSMIAGFIIDAEGSAAFETLIETGQVDQLADQKQIAGLKAGLKIAAKDYLKAMRIRRQIQEALRKMFIDFDVLVSPSTFGPAPKAAEALDRRSPDRPRPKVRGLSALGAAGNLAGLPSLSLPCGFADAVPVAIQLVGRALSENTLLAVGREFQSRTDWHKRRPPMPAG
jgi:aspartyl-tRNA(Asn)/glutamyl-tRNA(Gln) amidotransferase subunit A